MLRDSAVALVKGRLGNINTTGLDTTIVAEMQLLKETKLERGPTLPWFLLYENEGITTAVNVNSFAVPTGFLREYEYSKLAYYDSSDSDDPWKEMTKDTLDKIEADHSGTADYPTHYAVLGATVEIRPTPTAAQTFRWYYFKEDTDIDAGNTETNWLKYASDWIIAEICRVMSMHHLKNAKLAGEFRAEAEEARRRVFIEDEARKHVAMNYMLGD